MTARGIVGACVGLTLLALALALGYVLGVGEAGRRPVR